ncbi:MAG: NAD-glutamate dehydrogenase [Spongiibacteraceae bacterium]
MAKQQEVDRKLAQLEEVIIQQVNAKEQESILRFARQLYSNHVAEDFRGREISDIYGSTMGSWAFIQQHDLQAPKVRVFNPEYQKHGWQSGHTMVAVLARDMPFITDSVRGELNRRNLSVYTVHSVILPIVRNKSNQLQTLLPARTVIKPPKNCRFADEALLYLSIGRCTDTQELQDIASAITEILNEVAVVVDDFPKMVAKAKQGIAEVGALPQDKEGNREEVQAFLEWAISGHFTFLGYEQLAIDYSSGSPVVSRVGESTLGLLKCRDSRGIEDLQQTLEQGAEPGTLLAQPLMFAKSALRCRVHRQVYPDYIMLRQFNSEGVLVGKHRFLGLYTSAVYTLSTKTIPLIRKRVEHVLDRSGYDLKTHVAKELTRVLDIFPRDELFQSSDDELFATAMEVNKIQERRQVRLFVRQDFHGKFVNCLVYMPRDVYKTELRIKVEQLLCDAFGTTDSEFTTYFSESILARTYYVLKVNAGKIIDVDVNALEEEIVEVTMSWKEHLNKYLVDEFGEEQGGKLMANYGDAFNPGYMDDFTPRAAVDDIKKIAQLDAIGDIGMSFYRQLGEGSSSIRFRLFHLDSPLSLSDIMPILQSLGLRVESEHSYDINRKDGREMWVHDFSLTHSLKAEIDFSKEGDNLQQAFLAIWKGDAETDSFNRLILGAHLGWRQVAMLRAYAKYMRQIKFNFSGEYIAECLANHSVIAGRIASMFDCRFNVSLALDSKARDKQEEQINNGIIEALETVENLSEDRIIRYYVALIKATLRTNYFQSNQDGQFKNYFSFKLSPAKIPDMPLPVPMFEIFVYSPRLEGVHLRGGKVARGGLRWSDRLEDFRTEVLGLVKAQQVKNSVIVPMGAKGGFVAKCLPAMTDREAIQKEGITCYKTFIQGLLDITDNLEDGVVVPPLNVIRKDDDDTYLVVAADKGTATFSDIANELSLNAGFWLGDAFASGGSAGYDHKKMAITARGAWVSVQRHFRELGINIQETDFTVVGIGDMAGDVFGNGMLLSEHIQLTCAFNHQHIFIDPNPDSASSFVERKRLFNLPRSSWEDYNTKLISAGGGIFKRSAKSINISAAMKKRFDIKADKLTPNELINAVLKAPVDLLWNGGIGTYVKSSNETHADVGDKANDVLRVNGNELRCRVIGEGGNLGMTQLARVEYALNGGRCNTDFIDNSAGVDCSDHEVNIKILLNGVVAAGDMTEKQRNTLLVAMTDSISSLVLENNYRQTQAISMAESEAIRRAGEYRHLMHTMEIRGRLNRQLEFLPDEDVLLERRAANKSLTRAELSVLMSYVKSQLKEELVNTTIPEDEYLAKAVETAFPQRIRDDYREQLRSHRLRREIISTQLANDMVNHMGITFVDRIAQSTGVTSGDVVRAYVAASDIFDMSYYWRQIESLDYAVSADIQMQMMSELIRLIRRSTRWFLRNRRTLIDPAVEVANFKLSVAQLRSALPELLTDEVKAVLNNKRQSYIDQSIPEELATYIASAQAQYSLLGIIESSKARSIPMDKMAELYFRLSERLELNWFAKQITELKIDNHWQALAREAYRDDLEWQLRTLTEGAMRYVCDAGDIDACINRWMEKQHLMVERWRNMLTELHATAVPEFAMYSVAIRELLDLAQSSKYGDVE